MFDPTGLILTTASAVTGTNSAEVAIPGTGSYPATVIGRDEFFDIAVLRISPGRSIPFLSFTDPRGIVAGIPAVAVGYPSEGILGNAPTVLAGTVTGLRTLGGVTYLQTDTSLNEGNGGGPLSNNVGDVMGVNTTRVSEVFGQSVQGIGLSIHVSSVLERLGALKVGAEFYRPTTESDILPEGPTQGIAPFPNLFK
ncbi:MAG: trypsin-like peptidase domain-containing protein, partial [Chloroflexi bacterium]|nr:trypsin-like peptidase domain-containing protein [Chloroflexota bacterium]